MKGICFFLALVCLGGCGAAPDSAYVDISIPGVTIMPGEDKTFCFYTTYEGEDTGIWLFEPIHTQKYHNHLLVMTTDIVKPHGTNPEDCSDGEALKDLRPLIFPSITLGKENAIPLAKGTPIVLHSHYINAGKEPIAPADVARLYKVDPAEVDHWLAPMALANFDDFQINLDAQEHTLRFTCDVPRDMEPRLLGGHMHEHGESISISYKGGNIDQTIYSVDPWDKDNDPRNPPIWPLSYEPAKPMPAQFVKSSELSVRCTWKYSPTGEAPLPPFLKFPQEMCAAFGYMQHVGAAGGTIPTGDDRFFFCKHEGVFQ